MLYKIIMKNKIKLQKGFTLIEMLVAMSIFVIFMGVVVQSYLSIITSQREANEYRAMYSEARAIFDKFSDEVRNGVISYSEMGAIGGTDLGAGVQKRLVLFSPDQTRAVVFEYEEVSGDVEDFENSFGKINFGEFEITDDGANFSKKDAYSLNSDRVNVKDFKMYVSPLDDPFKAKNVMNDDVQFQPKVTVFARFSKEVVAGRKVEFDLQTTISSRSYMAGYEKAFEGKLLDGSLQF